MPPSFYDNRFGPIKLPPPPTTFRIYLHLSTHNDDHHHQSSSSSSSFTSTTTTTTTSCTEASSVIVLAVAVTEIEEVKAVVIFIINRMVDRQHTVVQPLSLIICRRGLQRLRFNEASCRPVILLVRRRR